MLTLQKMQQSIANISFSKTNSILYISHQSSLIMFGM